MNKTFRGGLAVAAWALAVIAGAQTPESPIAAKVELEWGAKIPLRDGVRLNATLYKPAGQKEPVPCVFTLTPYVSDTYHGPAVYFATHGLPFAIVDVRGRGNSEGTFRPMIQEARDGYDVVEWLARQPYCDGRVAMWGGSYAGYDQWATAKEFPPHLTTIVPAAAPYMGVDSPMFSNIHDPNDTAQWLTQVSGRTSQRRIYDDTAFWAGQLGPWYESGRPFAELDSMMGDQSATFHEWLSHPQVDSYWDAYNPTPEQYAKLQIPILTITGSYDGDQLGALAHYRNYMRAATPEGRARHYLIIGPWDHSGTRIPQAEFGGLKFGPASLVDLPQLHVEWYAWTMANGAKPKFLRNQVAYYVMGAEKWRYADTLEAVTAKSEPYFLDSGVNPTDVFQSGFLRSESASNSKPDHYVDDPRDTSDASIRSSIDPNSLVDQRMVYAAGGKELVYHSKVFGEDAEISGFFKLSAWLSIDQPDTDFSVTVYEIGADGSSTVLAADLIRARYRESLRESKLIRTKEPLLYQFDRFPFVSRRIKKGSRLRLVIGPVRSICCYVSYVEKNYNSGGVVAEESMKDARTVVVSLYHDHAHPSALYVPFGQPE